MTRRLAVTPPTIGRIVHYRLSETDAKSIERHRDDRDDESSNQARAGDVLPAIVVRTFGDTLAVNLRVFLDGADMHWATSRGYSVQTEGCWFWPPRVDMTREGR
jgi:hypothetical protein